MSLEKFFMKFVEKIHTGVNCQDQNYFSPGGTHQAQIHVIEQMWTISQPHKVPIIGQT